MEGDILDTLKQLYETQCDAVERWMGAARAKAAPHVYSSVDLRHSGPRLAPVDTNLYPAGFNNLSPNGQARAARFFKQWMEEQHPTARTVLIVPERHTRNLAYLDSLHVLSHIVMRAGYEVKIGGIGTEAPLTLTSLSGHSVTQHPLVRDGAILSTQDGITPDLLLLNNDCTAGPIALLEGIEQPVAPGMRFGWYQRRKSVHFTHYEQLIRAFAEAFSLDPWLLSARFHARRQVDFKARQGLDELAHAVDDIVAHARVKHAEYGITDEPYAFIKADSGTYGMGIMTARDGSELLEMNKKTRNKMQVIKEGVEVSDVIIQEGITSIDTVQGAPAEPMIYLIDGLPAGGMFRVNDNRDAYANLNAAGMRFTGMCDELEATFDCLQPVKDCHFQSFGLIAAIAALAAGREQYP